MCRIAPELSATELDDITERIERLVDGLVPLDLDFLTGGDLDDLGGIVSNISNIIGSLIKGVPLFSLNTRNRTFYARLSITNHLVLLRPLV